MGLRPAAQQLLLGVRGDPRLVVHSGPAFAPVHPGPGHATQPRPQPAHAAGGGEAAAGGGAEEGCSTAGEAEVRLVFLLSLQVFHHFKRLTEVVPSLFLLDTSLGSGRCVRT